MTFANYSNQHPARDEDNLADIVESAVLTEGINFTVAKTAAIALLVKIKQLGQRIQNADSKALSGQLELLGALNALAIATIANER